MKKSILSAAIVTSLSLSALSFNASADTPSFDYVEGGYTSYDFDVVSDVDGFELGGSVSLTDSFYATADYADVSKNGVDLSLTTLGVGYKSDYSNTSSFFTEVNWANLDSNVGSDENGYELALGIRSMITKDLELKVAAEYLDIDNDDNTYLVLGAAYNLTDNLAVYSEYKTESDDSQFSFGARYNF